MILDADPRVTETIKWQAPTFMYRGNIASFYPKTKTHVSLMFHTGASLRDPTCVLEGDGDTSRVLRILNHCQGPGDSAHRRSVDLPAGGHQKCPVMAS